MGGWVGEIGGGRLGSLAHALHGLATEIDDVPLERVGGWVGGWEEEEEEVEEEEEEDVPGGC